MGVAGAGVGIGRVDDAPVGGEVRVADAQIDYVGIALQRLRVQRKAARVVLETLGNVSALFYSSPFTCGTTVLPLGMT